MYIDPRGPHRKWLKIERGTSSTLVTLECGHVAKLNPIYDYSLDPTCRCFQCGEDAREAQKGDQQ
jgi:hypothetical protein